MTEAAATNLAARGADPSRLFSDDRLVRRATRGDQRAFEAIYRRYHQDLYRFCLAMVGNSPDAQDALQNTMVKVLRALPGEKRQIQLRPWLYRIARNEAVETVRRRREGVELDPERIASTLEIAETTEARERLRKLVADLGELPDRQRAALVMRELAGLEFEQIGATFETSAAAARQTVYEARLSLRQMEEGREMSCEAVMRKLSDADGRVTRGRQVRAHLRSCASCRAFRDSIGERREGLAAIAPLPVALSAGLLQGLLSGQASAAVGAAGAGAGGSLVGTVGAGAGKAVATSAIVKSAATVAVVAVGATAADRSGLIDIPLPGASEPAKQGTPQPGAPKSGAGAGAAAPVGGAAGTENAGRNAAKGKGRRKAGKRKRARGHAKARRKARGRGHRKRHGRPKGLPPASRHGQETAAARKPPQANSSPSSGSAPSSSSKSAPAPAPSSSPPHEEKSSSPPPSGGSSPSPPSSPPGQSGAAGSGGPASSGQGSGGGGQGVGGGQGAKR